MTPTQWLLIVGLGTLWFLNGAKYRLPGLGHSDEAARPKHKRAEVEEAESLFISPWFRQKHHRLAHLENPSPEMTEALSHKTGRDRKALEKAFRLSQEFHGTPTEVVELEPSERKVGKYVVVAGALTDFSYLPGDDSKRGQTVWTHKSGDRGAGQPESPNDPLVVVDPDTRRPIIIPNKSPMRLDSRQGFIG
jgi:hypothetical protein